MATVNQMGSGLMGQTGTGQVVGTSSPIISLTRTDPASNIGGTNSTFTLNGVFGRIATGGLSTAVGAAAAYTWNNTYLTTTSQVFFNVTYEGTSTRLPSPITCTVSTDGVGDIRIYNYSPLGLNGTVVFNYIIF